MILRERLLPEEDIYPIDDWRMIQARLDLEHMPHAETIFALANGYLGMRGGFDEGRPIVDDGTLVNGFYEIRPISYPEEGYGFPRVGQTILYVPEGKVIRLYIDDEPFDISKADVRRYERVLDMRAGVLQREVEWVTAQDKRVVLKTTRLVSFRHRNLAAIDYELTVVGATAEVVMSSDLVHRETVEEASADPRKAPLIQHRALTSRQNSAVGERVVNVYATERSNMWLGCGMDHRLETACPHEVDTRSTEDFGAVVYTVQAQPDQPIRLTKVLAYHTEANSNSSEMAFRAETTLSRAIGLGFARIAEEQQADMDDFWRRSDVELRALEPRAQQVIRWNLFQLLQASGRVEGYSIPARGLTGRTYEGHYFWDAEVYDLPFLIYSTPHVARHLLKHRYQHLEQARGRARELSHRGALFPWRTINGQEASTYFLAGTAQYHINASIMYSVKKYVDVTGDDDFLFECGAEMFVETARLWLSLGSYPESDPTRFHINGVTGPDEYTALVNNNFYTNVMAQENLRNAAAVVERMEHERPDAFRALARKIGLEAQEVAEWRKAADNMIQPDDDAIGIHLQDDSFLQKPIWDFANTPREKYPLMLHYHYLELYRHQVIKQADTILAMFLLGHRFSLEDKRRNFDYYDPLTTGDSSLSACIQCIVAAEVGYAERALEYFRFAAVMDLADVAGNVVDGAHLAAIGGTWLALIYGFGGLHDDGGRITFRPKLPQEWQILRFPLTIRGQVLDVEILPTGTTYTLREGAGLTIEHEGEEIRLTPGEPVTRAA